MVLKKAISHYTGRTFNMEIRRHELDKWSRFIRKISHRGGPLFEIGGGVIDVFLALGCDCIIVVD